MAFTRFNYDKSRTSKLLQESTGPGRYVLNAPGPGSFPEYFSDPHIRLTNWGGNLRSDSLQIENDLKGLNRKVNRDLLKENNYKTNEFYSTKLDYNTNNVETNQSRTTHPAWIYRGYQRETWDYLPLNPQEHTCIPFENNLSSRILEKDYYVPCYKI